MAALEQLLAQDKLYAKQLKPAARRWFTQKILEHAQVTNAANLLTEATNLLTNAKNLVSARLDKTRGSLVDDLKRVDLNELRARIVYGVLGSNPGIFLSPTGQNDLLDFIVERRFRSIQRMLSYVNPNRERQIMAYPPAGPLTAQVSIQTRTFWQGVNLVESQRRYPFVLTQLGKQSPKDAIEKLFEKNTDIANRTRLDCPGAAMTVHLDALLVAKDPDKLANALANESNDYLALDNAYNPWRLINNVFTGAFTGWVSEIATPGPNAEIKVLGAPRRVIGDVDLVDMDGRQTVHVTELRRNTTLADQDVHIESTPLTEATLRVTQLGRQVPVGALLIETQSPSFHAANDPRPEKSLFERNFIPENDLQVGDHIYLANHPIHRSRLKSTIWNGEHSFVLDPWQGSRAQMLVTGHGVHKKTVEKVVWSMLEEINAFLEITRKTVDAWLALPTGATPVHQETAVNSTRELLARILLQNEPSSFQGTVRFFDMPAISYRKNKKDRTYPPFWIMELEGTAGTTTVDRKKVLIFDYDPERTTPKLTPPTGFNDPIAVLRHDDLVRESSTPKHHYGVSYIDDQAGVLVFMPLYFHVGTKKGKPVSLDFSHIEDSVIAGTGTADEKKIFVVRPQVRSTLTYLTFLKQIGAIL